MDLRETEAAYQKIKKIIDDLPLKPAQEIMSIQEIAVRGHKGISRAMQIIMQELFTLADKLHPEDEFLVTIKYSRSAHKEKSNDK